LLKLGKPRTTKGLATLCAKIADDKLAEDVIIMDLSEIENAPSDFFVICSCDSDIQVRAISDAIENEIIHLKLQKPKMEGLKSASWVLLDFFDVLVHIMMKHSREFYKLEKLWGDAKFMVLGESSKLNVMKAEQLKKFY
jgi:ribosome-associated protein